MSEQIGKEIAEQFGEQISKSSPMFAADQHGAALNDQIVASFKEGISKAVDGFNKNAQSGFTLALLDGGNRVIFNLHASPTLTLLFRDQLIELSPSISNTANPTHSKVAVMPIENGFNYKFVSASSTYNTPLLSEEKFIAGIIKAACCLPFDAE